MSELASRRTYRGVAVLGLTLIVLAAGSGRGETMGLRERSRGKESFVGIDQAEPGDPVEVRGVVMRYGSEPHTYPGILVPPGGATGGGPQHETVYRLEVDTDVHPPAQIEGRSVIVRGRLVSPAVGPGFPAVIAVTDIERPE